MSELDKILKKAEKEHDTLKHPYVGTEHLLLALLSYDNELTDYLKEFNLTYNKFKRKLINVIGEGTKKSAYVLYTPMLRKVLKTAKDNTDEITSIDLFNSLLNSKEGIAIRLLEELNIDVDNIEFINNEEIKITNRDEEINEIFQILMRKNKCNPLLIGDAGVGKTAIVEEVERRLKHNEVPTSLMGYKIKKVDLSSILAGTKYRGDFEDKINKLLTSIENKKTIIFIDEIHTLVNAGGAEGAISASDIFKPYLARGKIKCIGATTNKEYNEYFKTDEALNRRFQQVIIDEPDNNKTLSILKSLKKEYEKYHKVSIDNNVLNEIIYISSKYITNKKNPDKSIELLDSVCTNARFKEQNKVKMDNLYDVFKSRYKLDISNKHIRNILDKKEILLATKDLLTTINCSNIIYIDGNDYKNDEDLLKLYGNIKSKEDYILKKALENPVGVITITNYNYNEILKEFILKLTSNRNVLDNFGNNINFNNYIIIMEKTSSNNSIGFTTNTSQNSVIYKEIKQKTLLPSI
ncbi:MAG: ATP-dependent Clp protease ATP-binding subunit [Firmicutes bacterium]|nr:ATP-dependent Clp protease ATP-binding subunit [Bacillota bacterium]